MQRNKPQKQFKIPIVYLQKLSNFLPKDDNVLSFSYLGMPIFRQTVPILFGKQMLCLLSAKNAAKMAHSKSLQFFLAHLPTGSLSAKVHNSRGPIILASGKILEFLMGSKSYFFLFSSNLIKL